MLERLALLKTRLESRVRYPNVNIRTPSLKICAPDYFAAPRAPARGAGFLRPAPLPTLMHASALTPLIRQCTKLGKALPSRPWLEFTTSPCEDGRGWTQSPFGVRSGCTASSLGSHGLPRNWGVMTRAKGLLPSDAHAVPRQRQSRGLPTVPSRSLALLSRSHGLALGSADSAECKR